MNRWLAVPPFRLGAVAWAVTQWLWVANAVAAEAAGAVAPTFASVGTGLHRDLPPPKLIPDAARLPKGAADGHPPGVAFRHSVLGLIYTDPSGRTLYQMKVSGLRFRPQGDTYKYCVGPCAEIWTAFAAPANAPPIGAWKVVEGVKGPQWAYGNNTVYTYTGDRKPGDLNGHEFEDMFMAINYIPPLPKVTAPGNVAPVYVHFSEYVLADQDGRTLYAYANPQDCRLNCARLQPFAAGMASRTVGEWTVIREGDRPQWAYRGKRVYVASVASEDVLDAHAVLRP
jgi:predicted lipoprotein with Yx(FWY)xxD motif